MNPRLIKEKKVEPKKKKKKVVHKKIPPRQIVEKLKITDKDLRDKFLGRTTDSEKDTEPDDLHLQKLVDDPDKVLSSR